MLSYLDFEINFSLFIFLSSSVLQSTDYEITDHLVSVSANFPLNIGELADRAINKGDNIAN